MATESIHVSALIPATPQAVYDAWLSSEQHAEMTGGGAEIEPHVGGEHRAWDNYITGQTLELDPGKRIVQSWRTLEFPKDSDHSKIVVTFEEEGGQTRVSIAHTDIPQGQGASYQSGWDEHYFTPMTAYFSGPAEPAAKPAKKPAARKATAKKAAPKKTAKKAAPKKTARKAAPKKTTARKGAKKTTARKGAKKTTARKGAKKTTAKKKAAK